MPQTSTLAARHIRLRDAMASQGLAGLIVTAGPNIRYLTNHAGSAGILIATPSTMHLIVDGRYTESVRSRQATPESCPALVLHDVPASYEAAAIDVLAELGASPVGFEAANVSVARHSWWVRTLADRGIAVELRASEQ